MRGPAQEYSAGGVLTRGGKVLLIRMRVTGHPKRAAALRKGDSVWTYPKGHLEKGETPRRAALREAAEETGYECAVVAPLALIRYSFTRKRRPVRKRVRWYWMRPLRKVGVPDAKEISASRWLAFSAARRLLSYPADFRLLEKVRRLGAVA